MAAEMMVSEGGVSKAGRTGGTATSARIGEAAKKPWATMAIKAVPDPSLVVNQ